MGFDRQTGGDVDDPSVDSLSTDDALNSDIGDSIDYLDPFWMVQSKAIVAYYTYGELASLRNLGFTSGSGNISMSKTVGLRLATGSTDDSNTLIDPHILGDNDGTWDNNRQCLFRVEYSEYNTSAEFFIGVGTWGEGGSTSEHLGFVVEKGNNNIKATCADGSTQNTSDTGQDASQTNIREFIIEWDTSEARFFVDGTKQATLSSNLPSGDSNAEQLRSDVYNASSSGSGNTMDIRRVIVVQNP